MITIKNVFATVLLLAIILVGCKKAEIPTTQTQMDSTINEIDMLTTAFINQKHDSKENVCIDWAKVKKVIKTVGADIGGSLVGAGQGLNIGKHFDTPPSKDNAKKGVIAGGVAGGTAASIAAGTIAFGAGLGSQGGTSDLTANALNPLDHIGAAHYAAMDEILSDEENYLTAGEFDITACYNSLTAVWIAEELFTSSDFASLYPLSACSDDVDYVNDIWGEGFDEFIETAEGDGVISFEVESIMASYDLAMKESESVEDFVDYSIEAEILVDVSETLTDEEKDTLLIAMATGRYGIQYWMHYAE